MVKTLPTPYCILLVEDDELLRETLAEYLEAVGYQVLRVDTGERAKVLLLGGQTIDLVLSDINLPGAISGEDLAQLAYEYRPSLPVILTSGRGRGKPLKGNLHRFMPKPHSLNQVVALIRQLLASSS